MSQDKKTASGVADLRARARIPFGYSIVDGKATIDEHDADILKQYYEAFLSGASMADAARQAGLKCSSTTLPHFFRRKEYVGTEYYPAIITPDYQDRLIAEWKKRAGEAPFKRPPPKKGVKIYTEFSLDAIPEQDDMPSTDYISNIYNAIQKGA